MSLPHLPAPRPLGSVFIEGIEFLVTETHVTHTQQES